MPSFIVNKILEEELIPNQRYEIKMPFPSVRTAEVMAWVSLHPEHWRRTYPPRQVNNIYFDTFSAGNLNDNLSGISERSKLRIRWYGTKLDYVENAQFELKRKKGVIGWKDVIPIPFPLNLANLSWYEIKRLLKNKITQAFHLFQQYPVPTIINSYHREYYASSDEQLRLTIDTNLVAYDQQTSLLPNTSRLSLPEPYTVVEIKTSPDNVGRLAQVLTHDTLQVTRFSKYVHAVLASSL